MFIILFFATAFFLYLNFSCVNYFKNADSKLRTSIIQTLIFISAFIFISTELLSLFNAINTTSIIITWSFILILSIINWIRWGKHFPHQGLSVGVPTNRNSEPDENLSLSEIIKLNPDQEENLSVGVPTNRNPESNENLSVGVLTNRNPELDENLSVGVPTDRNTKYAIFDTILFYSICIILLITLLTALIAAPNNWDSMTYHLSRVMHWIQNGNVNFYPTQIDRQLTQPPFAEYFILHLQLLTGSDRFANIVQWCFFSGSIIVVTLIAKSFNSSIRNQLLAGFFAATIPMAILQSNSTQNDIVIGFFVVAAIYSLIRNYKTGFYFRTTLEFYLLCVLAMLTKGTAFIFLLPVVIAFASLYIYKKRLIAFPSFFCGLFIVSILYFPFVYRNYTTYKYPLGKTYELNNTAYGIAPMFSNAVKNTAMHLRTPFPVVNKSLTESAIQVNNISGININSPSYNWAYTPDFEVGYFSTHEDSAANFLQVILFLICFIAFLGNRNLRQNRLMVYYLAILIIMFLTFCYVLKWQVWHGRLQLPMFIALAVFLAFVINRWRKIITGIVVIIFIFFASTFLFINQARPWFLSDNIFNTSRTDQYFRNNSKLKIPFTQISNILQKNNFNAVGYVSSGDSWEYPFFILNKDIKDFRLENIYPENETISLVNKSPFNLFKPDVIIINRMPPDVSGLFFYLDNKYSLIYEYDNWSLYSVVD